MVSNIDLILASILTANLVICPIVGFPDCIFNILACIITVICLLYRNVDIDIELEDDDLGGV